MSEIEDLKRKLAAREGKAGYGPTVEAMKKRIAELEAQQ
jgi:hypothetical protein